MRTSARAGVKVIGKFWSLHNPQKLRMCQISYKHGANARQVPMPAHEVLPLECVKVPMPAHQVLPLTTYIHFRD